MTLVEICTNWGRIIKPITVYHCCYPGCIARFSVEEDGDRYSISNNIAFHDHTSHIEPSGRNTISTFLSEEVDILLKAGIPTQSALLIAYIQLGIDINKHPFPFFALNRKTIDMRRMRLGKHYRFANNELESLKIFTEIIKHRQPEDLCDFDTDGDSIGWIYSCKRAKQIAQNAEELFIDSTFKLTIRRAAYYAVIAEADTGHGFPVSYMMIQPDTAQNLAAALTKFKQWVGQMKLSFIISDCAKQIDVAVSQVFGPAVTHRWCSFHVLRAVAKSSKHFSLRPKFDRFFNAFHELCCTELDEDGVHAQIAIIDDAIRIEPQAKKYYEEQWKDKSDLWIRGSLCNVTLTNNFCEGHFRSLKYRYLGGRSNFRLDELIVLIVTEVIPDMEVRLLNDQITSDQQIDVANDALNDAQIGDDVLDSEFIANLQTYCENIIERVRQGTLDRWTVNSTLRHLLADHDRQG